MSQKETLYMVCDMYKGNVNTGALNIGVEYMGDCSGRLLKENGEVIGSHHSSSFGWLRSDLLGKIDNKDDYNIVDLIGKEVPERFKLKQ